MYCELKDKEVELHPALPIKIGNGNVVKTLYSCDGGNIEIEGVKIKKSCDMMRHEKCLLNRI